MEHLRIITKNHTNPAYAGALVGARSVAARMSFTLDHRAPVEPDNVEQQCELLHEAVLERPDAIVLLPAHSTGVNDAIDHVNRAAIPLVLFVSEPSSGEWVGFVGSDDVVMAAEVARNLLRRLRPDAAVAIIDGHPGSITTPQRRRGFERALAEFPGMRLIGSASGYYQQAPGAEAASMLLAPHARLDALLVANDLMAMGALEACERVGRIVPAVSINGTPDAIAAVRDGRLVATASFNTHSFGCLAAEMAIRHLRGQPVPSRIMLPAEVIDGTNAARWDKPYELRACPDWDRVTSSDGSVT